MFAPSVMRRVSVNVGLFPFLHCSWNIFSLGDGEWDDHTQRMMNCDEYEYFPNLLVCSVLLEIKPLISKDLYRSISIKQHVSRYLSLQNV